LLEAINSGKAPRFARSVSNVANLANHYSPTLNINVQGGKESRQLASAIAQRVGDALSKMQRPDRWRYKPSQMAAMAGAHVTKAQRLTAETSWRS